MRVRKITQINLNFIIFVFSLMMFFSCNVTKHLGENEKLLVKNIIIIDKSDLDKKDAGFEEYDIEQLIKPEPNSKSLLFGIPIRLRVYNLYSEEEVQKEIKRKEKRCTKRKKQRISAISKRIKHYETKNLLNIEQKRHKKKFRKLQKKKTKKEEKSCKKQHWSRKLGEPPVTLGLKDEDRNKKRIRVFLKNKGYYKTIVKIDIENKTNYFQEIFLPELGFFQKGSKINTSYNNFFEKKIKLKVFVSPGQVCKIDKLNYNISDLSIRKLVASDKPNSLLQTGNRLDVQTIENERKRISDKMRNLGYYDFSRDYIFFSIDTIGKRNQADITINIAKILNNEGEEIIHKKHIIQNVYIYPYFKPNEALINKNEYYKNHDTIIYYSKDNKKYHLIYNDIPRINPNAIVRGLYIEPGNYFNLEQIKTSYKYLASLPIIQTANINFNETNTLYELTDSAKYINCEIKLTQDKLQAGELSSEFTHTDGNIGIGGTLNYTHNNFFRNTETFNLKLNRALNRITKNPNYTIPDPSGLFNSKTFGADVSIKFPRLFAPLPLKGFIQRSNPKTIVTGNLNYINRPDYKSSIAGFSWGYNWNTTNSINHAFTLLTNDFVRVYDRSKDFETWINENQLEENYESHLIFGSSYKFSFNNNNLKNRKNYFFFTIFGKAVGNSLYLSKKHLSFLNQEKENGSYTISGNAFAQFLKTDIDIRYYRKLNRAKDNLIFRFFAGAAIPYGNLNAIPFIEQYFSGGTNGIRAWEERSLGPGSYTDTSQIQTIIYRQRGDIKLEGNFEYRMKLFGKLEGALFIDAGNVWSINQEDQREGAIFDINSFYKEIAIGSGFGVRIDLDFLIIRLDLGLKVKDPSLPEGDRWIPTNNLFRTNNMKFNLGIGYPF